MNQNEQTQVDLLLRRYARRNAEAVRGAQASSSVEGNARGTESSGGAHLDADELNAYAEGALPQATRVRYMTHLADCDACRRNVTALTLAAGIPNETGKAAPSVETSHAHSWREWLALMFAPPVVRYGVPALALCLVITAALIATRSSRPDAASFVVQNEQSKTNASTSTDYDHGASAINQTATQNAPAVETPTANKAETANANVAPSSTAPGGTLAPPPPAKPQTGVIAPANPASESKATADAPAPKDEDNVRPPATAQAERKSGEEALSELRSPASAPAPQQPLARVDKEEQAARLENSPAEKKRDVAGNRAEPSVASVNKSAQAADDRADSSGGAAASGAMVKEKPARRPASSRGRAATISVDGASETSNEVETRNAGGRRFRREGGAWIDTAYNSSRATINVARGSEQYRALVADEPAIGQIANQLGGTVVIVWKGRAYRIR